MREDEFDFGPVYRKKTRYRIGVVRTTTSVREAPDFDSEILSTARSGTQVEIDNEESTRKFFKIYTQDGIEGYVPKNSVRMED